MPAYDSEVADRPAIALMLVNLKTPIESNLGEVYDWNWVIAAKYHTCILANPADKIEILQGAWASIFGAI